ncbi:tetratricopeptide repeat protein [Skermanella mucosa]|uniref:O-linked N-acetylglucosamine transferase, SPINDLY family protein n=1 Tax=Skermanella mucosa TaxID=1789672 RepID=UPI00192B8519|nr:glycosyltransferase family 41 protein [Skermanella mucosa]UEM20219.1 tetratricopeptide repeat protein [Skermanella mucosa]
MIEQLAAVARRHQAEGRPDKAEVLYRQALVLDGSMASLHRALGTALEDQGRVEEAAGCYRRTLVLAPDDADGWCDLGMALRRLARTEDALVAYRRAIALEPGFVEAWFNLGNAFTGLGRFEEAIRAYRQALALRAGDPEIWCNLGNALHERGRIAEAAAAAGTAMALRPDHAPALVNLGNALIEQGRFLEALAQFRRAAHVRPADPASFAGAGIALRQQGLTEEARASFRQAWKLGGDPGLEVRMALSLPIIPESEAHIREVRERLADGVARLAERGIRLHDPLAQVGQTCFYLAYHAADDLPLQRAVASLYEAACPDLLQDRADPPPRPDGRTHIGFVSQYWHQHTIAKLNLGLIRNLDRERFHVTLFTTPHAGDAMRHALVRAADATVELPLDLKAARDAIAARRLDVLYYADIGMSALTYFLAFARLAPLQCLTWGHPDTTGIRNLDRFLSCGAMEPDGAERHYSERLVRLPGTTLHYARPRLPARPKPRSAFGLPDDARLYVCPQSLFKIHPDFDRALVDLLRRDPQGLVVLLSGRDRNLDGLLRRRLAAAGADVAARFRFLRQMPLPDFLSLVACSDVMLDPLHYSGGNTSLEAFALGTPIVTWPGAFMRGRHTYGFYRLMGLDDCVARDHGHYVDLALALAREPDRRTHVIRSVLDRVPVLFDDTHSVRAIENEIVEAR